MSDVQGAKTTRGPGGHRAGASVTGDVELGGDQPLTEELGTTGLKKFSGVVFEEFLPRLQGTKGRKVYREMGDNDPTAGVMLFTLEQMARRSELIIEPGGTDPESREALEVAEFVEGVFQDMSQSQSEMMSEVATMYQYGWSALEIVYKKRVGTVANEPGASSRFDDGMWGWRKLAPRAQETLHGWTFDDGGGVAALVQLDPWSGHGVTPIPIQRLLLFRTTSRRNNPEGFSVLRRAYRPWFFKKRIEEIEAIGIERELTGLPVFYVPSEYFLTNDPKKKALLDDWLDALRDVRRDQQDGMLVPNQFDDNGNQLFRFELASTGGRRSIDTNETVRRLDQRMAMSILADWVMLGQERVGSFAMADVKTDIFASAVDSWNASIAQVFERHGVPRLLQLNGIPLDLAPSVRFETVKKPTLDQIASFVKDLSDAGVIVSDDELESQLREMGGLPPPSEETASASSRPNVRNEEDEVDRGGATEDTDDEQ